MFYIFNRLDNFLVSNRTEKKLTNVEMHTTSYYANTLGTN